MRTLIAFLIFLTLPVGLQAQTPVAVPNPMASHTPFVVIIVAAFLAWAASFSIATRHERNRKVDSKALMARREEILDELADAEAQQNSGSLSKEQFNKKTRRLRGQLAGVIAQLERRAGEKQTAR